MTLQSGTLGGTEVMKWRRFAEGRRKMPVQSPTAEPPPVQASEGEGMSAKSRLIIFAARTFKTSSSRLRTCSRGPPAQLGIPADDYES